MAIEVEPPVETGIDDAESLPVVERDRLYRLWEEGNWSAKQLDFTQDAVDWREKMTDAQRQSVRWNYAMFLDGEESVTVTLTPFVEAAWRYEDRIFLATQIADEARHHVFFDRFIREVVGIGHDLASTLDGTRPTLTWGYRRVFGELDRVADELRRHPRERALLAQGVVLYHLVIEGMLAHTGQHYLRDFVQRHDVFPGFTIGIGHISRDESRHIAFGVQLLRELVTNSAECRAATITMLNRVLPWAAGVFTPPNMDWSYLTGLDYTPQEIFSFGLRSIENKLVRAGIEPSEVLEFVKLGHADPPSDQATRIITFIEGRILGTDGDPLATEEVMEVLFASLRNVAAWTQPRQRGLRATIQWLLDGAQPRYLELGGPEGPRVLVGRAPHPTVTLRCTALDWARIAAGRLTQRRALMTRCLRIEGDWRLALRLPTILPV